MGLACWNMVLGCGLGSLWYCTYRVGKESRNTLFTVTVYYVLDERVPYILLFGDQELEHVRVSTL